MKKKLGILLKIFAYLNVIIIISIFVVPILLIVLNAEENFGLEIYKYCIITFFIIDFIFLFLTCIPGLEIESKKETNERYYINFENYNELLKYLKKQLIKNNYEEKSHKIKTNLEIKTFTKIIKHNKIEIISIVKVNELTEEHLNKIETYMTEFYKVNKQNKTHIYFIPIIIVDKLTPTFNKTLTEQAQSNYKYTLPIGYSLGGKTLYIGVPINNYKIIKIKEMKKRVCEILEIENNPKYIKKGN